MNVIFYHNQVSTLYLIFVAIELIPDFINVLVENVLLETLTRQ